MKRMIYLASVGAIVALTGCAHDHAGRGGTYDYNYDDDNYHRGSDTHRGQPGRFDGPRSDERYYYDGHWHDYPPPTR